jgi:hypothetical protein
VALLADGHLARDDDVVGFSLKLRVGVSHLGGRPRRARSAPRLWSCIRQRARTCSALSARARQWNALCSSRSCPESLSSVSSRSTSPGATGAPMPSYAAARLRGRSGAAPRRIVCSQSAGWGTGGGTCRRRDE